MSEAEMPAFIERHLRAAGARRSIFEADSVSALFQHTRGVPRLVQNLALGSMLVAMQSDKKTVDSASVQQALADWEAA